MHTNPSRTYGEIGRKLDDYQKIEELVIELESLVRKVAIDGRLSNRLKALFPTILSKECQFAISCRMDGGESILGLEEE